MRQPPTASTKRLRTSGIVARRSTGSRCRFSPAPGSADFSRGECNGDSNRNSPRRAGAHRVRAVSRSRVRIPQRPLAREPALPAFDPDGAGAVCRRTRAAALCRARGRGDRCARGRGSRPALYPPLARAPRPPDHVRGDAQYARRGEDADGRGVPMACEQRNAGRARGLRSARAGVRHRRVRSAAPEHRASESRPTTTA